MIDPREIEHEQTKKTTKTSSKRAEKARASARTTKTDRVIEMLRAGATPEALMKATVWQAHSLRGFISGTLRKKLGLAVVLEDGKYSIAEWQVIVAHVAALALLHAAAWLLGYLLAGRRP